jgi:undecaprenyl-diphosphatase
MIEIFFLSIIQGITEFLPVSSSSHLILISNYIKFESQSLAIDVSLHIGSFFAVITYFRKDIYNLFINKDLFLKILISSIPVMIAGYLLVEFNLIEQLRNIKIIAWTTIIFGIILFISDKFEMKNSINRNFNYKSAIFIGILQILSLVPGVSRSGITISAARILKFNRYESAKISFLFSIPTLAAVSLFGLKNLITSETLSFSILNVGCILFSFIFSFITIKFFLKYIKSFSLNIFVIYRIILGIILLIFSSL